MFCRNCGAKLPDGSNFCTGCGAAVNAAPNLRQSVESKPRQKSTGLVIVLIVAIAVSLILGTALVVVFISGAGTANDEALWQEQYDLGTRYLLEGKYEEAVIAFCAAIDIDPKRPEAYIGAAEAYIGLGDEESAREILEEGSRNTGETLTTENEGSTLTQPTEAVVEIQIITLSREEQYKINTFLSAFSEQWFCEDSERNAQTGEWEPVLKTFDANNADTMQIVRFAWMYRYINMFGPETITHEDYPYSAYRIDELNDITRRFFNLEIDPAKVHNGEKNEHTGYSPLVIDGMVGYPAAAGASYTNMTVAREMYDIGDGTYQVNFDIYTITDFGEPFGENGLVEVGGKIQDESLYYYTPEEAQSHRYFEHHIGGVAVVRPYTADDGTETYRLIRYEVGSHNNDQAGSNPAEVCGEWYYYYDTNGYTVVSSLTLNEDGTVRAGLGLVASEYVSWYEGTWECVDYGDGAYELQLDLQGGQIEDLGAPLPDAPHSARLYVYPDLGTMYVEHLSGDSLDLSFGVDYIYGLDPNVWWQQNH